MKEKNPEKYTKISNKQLIDYVKESIGFCYGILGISCLTNKKGKKEELIKVVPCKGGVMLDIHVDVAFGVKITETIVSAQMTISHFVEKKFPKYVKTINVLADNLL